MFCSIATRPELQTIVAKTSEVIFSAAQSGIYGCTVEVNDPESRRILQSFYVRLGYQAHIDSNTLSLYWTTLRQ